MDSDLKTILNQVAIITLTSILLFSIVGSLRALSKLRKIEIESESSYLKSVADNISSVKSTVAPDVKGGDDYLEYLLRLNDSRLQEYHTLSWQSNRKSFDACRNVGFGGFLVIIFGILVSVFNPNLLEISKITVISGTIVEITTAVFFALYSKAVAQSNESYSGLLKTQSALLSLKLLEKMDVGAERAQFIGQVVGGLHANAAAHPSPATSAKEDK